MTCGATATAGADGADAGDTGGRVADGAGGGAAGAGDACAAGGVAGTDAGGGAPGPAGCGAGGREEGAGAGATAQPARTQAANNAPSQMRASPLLQSPLPSLRPAMWLILLEAALALGLLVFIVWWTMFHRPRRKPPEDR
jgi:hypothetical protein